VAEAVQDALSNLDAPALEGVATEQAELVADVQRIIEKKAANKAVMPEEFQLLARFADLVERRLQAARDVKRQARLKEIDAVRSTLPPGAFLLPVEKLDITDDLVEVLQPLGNVGEIMLRFLIDEQRVGRLLENLPNDPMARLQAALDKVVIPDIEQLAAENAAEDTLAAEPSAEVGAVGVEEEVVRDAFGDEPAPLEVPGVKKPILPRREERVVEPDDEDEEVDALMPGTKRGKTDKKKKKKERQQRRQLIFDEEIGQVIAKRRRKGGRAGEWTEGEE
jgi:hypothetical protein